MEVDVSTQVDSGRIIRHIHDEMWSRLRRSTQPSCRSKEKEWWHNYEAIQTLRQQLIDNNCWGTTLRDRDFDTQLQLSLVTQLRQATFNVDYSEQFACYLLEQFRLLVVGEELQTLLVQRGLEAADIDQRILSHLTMVQLHAGSRVPEQVIIHSIPQLLRMQPSFG